MNFIIEFEQEDDGRWIAEIPELPGVMAYGATKIQAGEKAKALAFRVLADRIELDYSAPHIDQVAFSTAHEPMAVN
jgi:predicted RNase H-like HicB family nuclease